MNGNLLDTNVIIRFLGGDTRAKELLATIEKVSIPATVMGELYYGAYKSSRVQDNLTLIKQSLFDFPIISIDDSIADMYGEIKEKLRKKGVQIPENDLWIAATALSCQSVLVSFDSHFTHIEGLIIKN